MANHDLKIWPEFFEAVLDGSKNFDVRRDDRGFMVGDVIRFKEWDDRKAQYTGRKVERVVTYILRGVAGGIPPLAGIQRNHVVLALKPMEE